MINILDELQAIAGALVGGARYGLKIRVPHAIVMTILFRRDLSNHQKLRSIFRIALEHASNLASFAAIYKSILAVLKWSSRRVRLIEDDKSLGKIILNYILDGPFTGTPGGTKIAGHPERPYHALVAGSVGGYFIWGRYSSVNHQIILYLTSRVLLGLSKSAWERYHRSPHTHSKIWQHPKAYSLFAATVWGIVMALFEESPHVLHRSLKQSMDEIYRYQLSYPSSSSTVEDTR